MRYQDFKRRAEEVWEEIPDAYRSGVDGLVLEPTAKAHPTLPDIFTLGECLTETYPSDWGGPDTTRSVLVLYHGSFQRLAKLDPDFDGDYEIWETITHELRHHLEYLADEAALEDVDYAVDESFKRREGEPFDPLFFRSGEPLAPDVYEADREVYVEVEWGGPDAGDTVGFRWGGRVYTVPAPEEDADVVFVDVVGGIDAGDAALCVVLVRPTGGLREFWRWVRRQPLSVLEFEADAAPERP